jgi:DNA-binding GntR family transcriptional regulator
VSSTKPQNQAAGPVAGARGDRATLNYEQLRELIVQGPVAPCTWIIESHVPASLGVSRTPVGAAFHRLQEDDYITVTA